MKFSFSLSDNNCNILPVDHFPARFQAVIWRNWRIVPVERLAGVLRCTPPELISTAEQLGLPPPDDTRCAMWEKRGYQTIIRQNWHLLPVSQILEILNWTPEQFEYILKEDDFLWSKLGKCKPHLEPVLLRELTAGERNRTGILRQWYRDVAENLSPPTAMPFDFLERSFPDIDVKSAPTRNLRMIYSYSALYGDPLLEGTGLIYPDKLLDEYAAAGINALWLQAVIYTLIPWFGAVGLAEHAEIRLANLRDLARRMAARGIRLMLYLNEPRAMPEPIFEQYCPEWRGAGQRMGLRSFCTSNREVRDALGNAVEKLFRAVPELGGFFAITMSENPTNCWSHTLFAPPTDCPVCLSRRQPVVIAELISAMAEGAWRANPAADVIAWNWGWESGWDEQAIELLPDKVKLMCVSETGLHTDAAGIKGSVWDYSISKVGPGPWFRRLLAKAESRGMEVIAKVQLNNSWECSAVPYLPTPGLVEAHLNNLRRLGVEDFMLSWTLGGYPGGNIRLLSCSGRELAEKDFGDAAGKIMEAYECFDRGFACFPFNMTAQIYLGPQNFGPLNQLYPEPTGNRATMIGFPYDDIYRWTGDGYYPEDIFEEQYRRISEHWSDGLARLDAARKIIPADKIARYEDLRSVANAVYCHFRSSYLQISFIRLRHLGLAAVKEILEEEIRLAVRLIGIIRHDSRIGFEASNHYYYTENTLMEKIFNCRNLLDAWPEKKRPASGVADNHISQAAFSP